ncbi:MAG: hypothetical protein ACKVP5_07965 [Aestuariivirga sp.]
MSDTEQLFIVAAVWTVIAAFLARFVPNWGGRIALFAVLVGVPFWELPYGYSNFVKHCDANAKLQVLEPIEPQRSVCFDYQIGPLAEKLLDRGFVQVETKGNDGKFTSYSRPESQLKVSTGADRATSEYCVAFSNNNQHPWRVIRHDFFVIRSRDSVVVARHGASDWLGMWWQDKASPLLGRGGSCRSDQVQSLLAALLKGTK